MLRPAKPTDTTRLISIADATGVFKPGEAVGLLEPILKEYEAGRLGDGHHVVVWANDKTDQPSGWVYFSPSPKAEAVWDLWWIGVSPTEQNRGVGEKLLTFVEETVRGAGGRLLIIETSSTELLEKARMFYENRRYLSCGTIPDFYGEGDGKVSYVKKLNVPAKSR